MPKIPFAPHPPFVRPAAPGALLAAPALVSIFQDLGISVAVWTQRQGLPEEWYPMHVTPNVTLFEVEHSVSPQRYAYNRRMFDRVLRTGNRVLGSHGGFHDLFLPVGDTPELRRVLVAGPFATSVPTSSEILDRWYGITRTRGRLSDWDFAEYVSVTLSTLTLEGPLLKAFEGLLTSFGGLVGGQGDPEALAKQAEAHRIELLDARSAELMWKSAGALLDERKNRTWAANKPEVLEYLRVKKVPEHLLVALAVPTAAGADPLDVLLAGHGFQRATAAFARKLGNVLTGQAGDHGVSLIAGFRESRAASLSRLQDLVTRLRGIGRRFGFRLHVGASIGGGTTLAARYRIALGNAESSLQGGPLFVSEGRSNGSQGQSLRRLRSKLAAGIVTRPNLLVQRFEQYVQAAVSQLGITVDPLKFALASGLERITEPLLSAGSLDEAALDAMMARTVHAERTSAIGATLPDAYRKLVAEIQASVLKPSAARHERGVESSLEHIRNQLSEPLTLAEVARLAGFAPGYFSKLFKQSEGVTFQAYVLGQRLERAADMLTGTELTVERVRQLSGFRSRAYFNRAFSRANACSPIDYRRRGSEHIERARGR